MTSALQHRGPDDEGYWTDGEAGIGLGHRRLAILDLSPEGRQPMRSAAGRYIVSFNGEIYNFLDIRVELERCGVGFRGHSDTEVMLAAIERWGVSKAVERFAGMFAFALWDAADRTLYLVRDRLGEKPLYFAWLGRTLLFGSELKALRAHPGWHAEIDRGALALLLRHGYIPSPSTIYQGVQKVSPATILALRAQRRGHETCEQRYWSAREVVARGLTSPLAGSDGEIVDACEALLRQVISREMIADVPLGAFLSGGIDSSTVVALMQAQCNRPVRTFTIGFHDAEYNEADHARAVASYLGTEHTELYVTPAEMLAVIPRLPLLYDEPFADSSQIPTFLVSQLTRDHVTVSLSGDGGDEMFGGYTRYVVGERIWRMSRRVPASLRSAAGAALEILPRGPDWGDRMHKLARVLRASTASTMYRELMSQRGTAALLVSKCQELPTAFTNEHEMPETPHCVESMMYLDLVSYLPDDILVKVDRASMAVSLESRAPFLDHSVAELAWRVPVRLKFRDGKGKWLLRQVLYRYVPKELVERPKKGFGVPLHTWLSGPLRQWSEALLDPARLRREGIFNSAAVGGLWARHRRGARRAEDLLWTVLTFQAWLEAQGSAS
jgi:asparagine synthase (glutamine-hydrolysing)